MAEWIFTFSKYALREGAATQSLDGKLVSTPLGDLTPDEPLPMHALNFYPAHAIVLGRDYAMVFSLLPLSANSSQLATYWFVHVNAAAGRDYDPNRVTEFWDVTHRQDIQLCAINQQGVASLRYVPGPYSAAEEDDIDHFLDFYVTTMSQDSCIT
jgi:Rieske 2Fe-2S family protein